MCRNSATMRLLLCLLLTATALRADPLVDLRATLRRLAGSDPVRATVDFAFSDTTGDEKKPQKQEGNATAVIALDADGLRLTWAPDLLAAARTEADNGAGKPKQPTPTRDAISRLNAVQLHDYLDAAAELARSLASAKLLTSEDTSWNNQPARLLTLRLEPALSDEDKKVIKEIDGTARLWLAADGTPLAAESSLRLKGRVMMVVGFEHSEKEQYTFGRAGDRLVVATHQRETADSGGGQRARSKTNVTIRLNNG